MEIAFWTAFLIRELGQSNGLAKQEQFQSDFMPEIGSLLI